MQRVSGPARPDAPARSGNTPFPRLRWVALLFLVVWVPSYALVWGPANFLSVCDIAVILTVLGLWRWQAVLLSSQAVGSLFGNLLWAVDAGSRLLTGSHALGGTEYMWNAEVSLFVRLLSLFHLVLPVLHLSALRRIGYDGRGFALQAAILALLLVVSRLVTPATENLNFVYSAPLVNRPLGPGALHVGLVYAVMVLVMMGPTHLVLRRLLPASRPPSA